MFAKRKEMIFKAGDRVKFLNTTGGGIVSKVIGKDMVLVSIEEGFEIPVVASDIILAGETTNPTANLFRKSPGTAPQSMPGITEARASAHGEIIPGRYAGKDMMPGVYLAFLPMDQRMLTIGDMEVLFINYTSFPLVAQIYTKQGTQMTFNRQFNIPEMQSVILHQITREDLNGWLQGTVQFMLQPLFAERLLLPVHTSFNIKGVRFVKEESYENTSLDPRKMIPFLLKSSESFHPPEKKAKTDREDTPRKPEPQAIPFIRRHLTADGYAEVDLHIHAITDDYRSLNPMEVLNYQVRYFKKALDSAIVERIPKMVVVHGVGSGILKAEILKCVGEMEFAHTYDAPLGKYGVGATVIEFYHTKNK